MDVAPPPCLPSTAVPWEPQGRSLSTHYMLHGSGSPCRIANQALCLQAHDSIAVEWPLFLPAICCMSIKVCSLLRLSGGAPLRTRPPLSPSEYKMHSLFSPPAWTKNRGREKWVEASRGQGIGGGVCMRLFSSAEVNADVLLTLALQCLWPLAH